ncbi:MAG: 5'/3'-nucleotidase SurE [Kiritimatiellia bacterium]|nr:5'/3'-nucleotidase SurE [Lentisphaerota bacterium]
MSASILISNDDGIYAPGIMALYQAVRPLGEVTVVAPETEQSAVGHAITIADPIKVRPVTRSDGFQGYAVSGTPADCIKLAVGELLPRPPDLVISGINLGPNVGISVIYSGTVSAATEGSILGIPSLAVSLATFQDPLWETAMQAVVPLVRQILRQGLPEHTLLNVNVPNRPVREIRGFRTSRMGRSRFVEVFHRRANPRGDVYYWLDGELQMLGDGVGTDVQAVADNFVAITPLHHDLTHTAALNALGGWCPPWPES